MTSTLPWLLELKCAQTHCAMRRAAFRSNLGRRARARQYEVDPENRTSAEVVVLDLGGAGVNQNLKLENESQT